MALTKKETYELTKEMLHAKYDGKCALCGCDLPDKWQIWHIEPNKTIVTKNKVFIGNDSYDNKLPACASCNSTRVHKCPYGTIEDFRATLYGEYNFMRGGMMYASIYQKMLRYGLIEETGASIVFHFEKHPNR